MSFEWNSFPETKPAERPTSTISPIVVDLTDPNVLDNMSSDIINQIESATGNTLSETEKEDIRSQLSFMIDDIKNFKKEQSND